MKWIVYLTTNKQNGKLYIGVHKTENPDIFDGYIGNGIYIGNTLKNPKTVFQKALKKYGYSSFIRTTLYEYDSAEEAYSKEAEIVTTNFIKKNNNYNTNTGGLHGPAFFKRIYLYTLQGELVKIWEGGKPDIIDALGYSSKQLEYSLSYKVELHQYYWSFTPIDDFSEFRRRKQYYLYEYSLEGELINIYSNIKSASLELNINYNSLKSIILSKSLYRQHFWTTDPDNIISVIKTNKFFALKKRAIILYDLEGNILKEYSCAKELCAELNVCKQTVSRAALFGHTVLNKYKVKYTGIKNIEAIPILQIDYKTGEVVKEWTSIKECKKEHPKCKDVLKGNRNHTHGYTFKLKYDLIEDIV